MDKYKAFTECFQALVLGIIVVSGIYFITSCAIEQVKLDKLRYEANKHLSK